MMRWLPVVAIGALLALAGLVVVTLVAPRAPATDGERADALSRELRCPDCQGLSVADSPTRSAQEIRRQIDGLVADGASDQDVREHFVARYGEWILLAPSSPAVWIIPFVVVLAAAAGLGAWLTVRSTSARIEPHPTVTDEERRRAREEADLLDA